MANLPAESAQFRERALQIDAEDPLRDLRNQFIFPTVEDLKSKTIVDRINKDRSAERRSLYFCGNSLGVQPKLVQERVGEHLAYWAQRGVYGHFTEAADTGVRKFTDVEDHAAELAAPLVGASKEEVACMDTLTGNLHLAMLSFYRPTKERHKIIVEGHAFPSDHYAVESQLRHYGYTSSSGLITINPAPESHCLTTSQICATLSEHAASTALVLLPGIQYYTGQLFDIEAITRHAHSLGLTIGWDLAHAAGNVPLALHDWGVDFAVWCHYKYINAGPGAIGGLFVHERHTVVDAAALARGDVEAAYRARLAGWWGNDKAERFEMRAEVGGASFVPRPGAWGFQLSNPSALAMAALQGALEVFAMTDMPALRRKSLDLTGLLEDMLVANMKRWAERSSSSSSSSSSTAAAKDGQPNGAEASLDSEGIRVPGAPYWIITPRDPAQRGAQLSVQLESRMLEPVLHLLEEHGIVIDERRPDVIRVAPAPLYNTAEECWRFAYVFDEICRHVLDESYGLDLGFATQATAVGDGLKNGA